MPSSSADDELSPRESVLVERRLAALARFDERIPALYAAQIPLHPAVTTWADRAPAAPASLFLTGPIGVGKTHTAWQACRRWLDASYGPGRPWRGTPIIKTYRSTALFDALRPDAHEAGGRALVKQLQRCDLLMIDDLAAARPSEWTRERLFEIFDERYINRRPVIVTCDVLPAQLSEVTGPRVASRLAEMCRGGVTFLQGHDRRKQVAA